MTVECKEYVGVGEGTSDLGRADRCYADLNLDPDLAGDRSDYSIRRNAVE